MFCCGGLAVVFCVAKAAGEKVGKPFFIMRGHVCVEYFMYE